MHCSAEPVAVSGPTAHLRRGADSFVARILEPADACFELARPPAPASFPIAGVRQLHGRSAATPKTVRVAEFPRRDDTGKEHASGAPIRRLQIAWPKGARRLAVLLLPDWCGREDRAPPVLPLDHWLGRDPTGRDRQPWPRDAFARSASVRLPK